MAIEGYAEHCEAELALVHLQATLNAWAWHKPNRMPTLKKLLSGKGSGSAGGNGDVPTREQGVENARRWIALLGGAQPAPAKPRRARKSKA